VPLPSGTDDSGFIMAFKEILYPVALEFKPEIILVSAGMDAMANDGLASMRMSENGFAVLMSIVKSIATQTCNKVVLVLEGGYNLSNLKKSVASILKVCIEEHYNTYTNTNPSTSIRERIKQVIELQKTYWNLR